MDSTSHHPQGHPTTTPNLPPRNEATHTPPGVVRPITTAPRLAPLREFKAPPEASADPSFRSALAEITLVGVLIVGGLYFFGSSVEETDSTKQESDDPSLEHTTLQITDEANAAALTEDNETTDNVQ